MDTVKFANGDTYDCPAIYSDGTGKAFVILSNVSFVEAAQIATNTNMTSEFEWGGRRYIGFTHCQAISESPIGTQMILTGGHYEQI